MQAILNPAALLTIDSDNDTTQLTLSARTFVRPNASVAISYSDFNLNDSDLDKNQLDVSAAFRF
ncbi:MAG: hypothetical protein CMI02_14630 [Oceanospirillaceae bacterium]|nr:hypothetical protein [Oceanospirillaceae bacterium]MBT13258.1 hypothetical protein [Oceanospirillaceae bacterium]